MKTKIKIRQTLIREFGENFNTIDNLIEWLKRHYHPNDNIFTNVPYKGAGTKKFRPQAFFADPNESYWIKY